MRRQDEDGCGAESAGSGKSEAAAAEFDPFAEEDDTPPPISGSRSVHVGRPVSDAAYRALKERARARRDATDPAAQEDAHGSHDDEEKPET
ncbi:MAG TPA: hypothetical protein VGF28_09470 [Thermoanaerobaculia bacterium]